MSIILKKTWRNFDILDGDFRPFNLRKYPIKYPVPLIIIEETKDTSNGSDKAMYLYEIEKLPYIKNTFLYN